MFSANALKSAAEILYLFIFYLIDSKKSCNRTSLVQPTEMFQCVNLSQSIQFFSSPVKSEKCEIVYFWINPANYY